MLGRVLDHRTINGLTVVTLAGDLDVASVTELRRHLVASEAATLPDLALDLRDVAFIDCAVIGTWIAARHQVVAAGGCVRLFGLGERPARLLSLCRLEQAFCVHDSFETATAADCGIHRSAQQPVASVPRQPTRVAAITDEARASGAQENPALS